MEPKLKNGSFFMASTVPYFIRKPRIGDIIIFKHENKRIVKKIIKIENDKYYIDGENLKDSKDFGPIRRKDILGMLIFKF